jgi:hypothetical protein
MGERLEVSGLISQPNDLRTTLIAAVLLALVSCWRADLSVPADPPTLHADQQEMLLAVRVGSELVKNTHAASDSRARRSLQRAIDVQAERLAAVVVHDSHLSVQCGSLRQ